MPADQDKVVDALTHRVRLLSVDQVSRLIDGNDGHALLTELEVNGWITRETAFVSVPGIPDGPLFVWNEGDSAPDFSLIAYELRRRRSEPEEIEVVYPTAEACKRFGGTRVRPRLSEVTHDLLMAEAFLLSRGVVGEWRSGDLIRSDGDTNLFGGAVPDAAVFVGDCVRVIVEGGGSGYGKSKLNAMHSNYSKVAPYQLW